MKKILEALKRILFDSMGGIATSAFLICAASGVFLAIPYRIHEPFDSISMMLLDNPVAVYIRNIHYWSAQLFFVFTILHIIDHFIRKTEYEVSRGIWLRLTLSILVVFFVMISGFILKGDADAYSAFRILSALVERIPWAGTMLSSSFLGNENSLELIYVHHIATATIILIIIIVEHAGKIWPGQVGFILLLFFILILSFFLHPSFGQETGLGPWYFIGFQEILLWSSHPGRSWIIVLLVLFAFWAVPRVNQKLNSRLKQLLLTFFCFYILLTIIGAFFKDEHKNWIWPWDDEKLVLKTVHFHPLSTNVAGNLDYTESIPLIVGHREGCLVCHQNVTGFTASHDPAAIGCYSCHLGNPFTLSKKQAHKNMLLVPGNLIDAGLSCGTQACHPGIPRRVESSIMSTMSGVVTVDRFVFGEIDSLPGLAHIKDIGHTAADQHLRDLCANCHLGHVKTDWGPVTQLTRGGGCNACHLNYPDSAIKSLEAYLKDKSMITEEIFYHPQLSLNITDAHCFGCHSRSGRIATNYEGWHETLYDKNDLPAEGNFRVLEDERVFEFVNEDVHHKSGMNCIDCHISYELMGDGNLYAHKEEQAKIKCEDCHFLHLPKSRLYKDIDAEAKKIIALRKWNTGGRRFISSGSSGLTMVNAWLDTLGQAVLKLKMHDTLLKLSSPLPACSAGNSHKALSCESCHTSWVPQCIGCHNTYDPAAKGFDLLEYREKAGSWVEHVGIFLAEKPALGVVSDSSGQKQVKTFTPGMIISIDKTSYTGEEKNEQMVFRRLYSPVSAHTTVRAGRDCKSCHLDPLAIGYGRGELIYETSSGRGKWIFRNRFALNEHDRLPEDAWIGFLSEGSDMASTRANARPFNLKEQKAILTAAACLTCHDENSSIMKESLADFPALLMKAGKNCILPEWD